MCQKPMLLICTLILLATIGGCSRSSNPVSSSDAVQSGKLQYIFSSSKTTYSPGDTLVATVTVHNSGPTQAITVGDGLFQWAFLNPSGDTVMAGRVSSTFGEEVAADSGKTVTLYTIDRVLEAGSSQTLQTGLYFLKAEVRPMSFMLRLSIQ